MQNTLRPRRLAPLPHRVVKGRALVRPLIHPKLKDLESCRHPPGKAARAESLAAHNTNSGDSPLILSLVVRRVEAMK